MVRDRGNIKWNSMMLPEHVKLLKEYNEDLKKVEKPALDEQKYEEFNEVISRAAEEKITLEFTYYQKGKIKKLVGKINQMDSLKKEIHISSKAFNHQILELNDILEIEYYLG